MASSTRAATAAEGLSCIRSRREAAAATPSGPAQQPEGSWHMCVGSCGEAAAATSSGPAQQLQGSWRMWGQLAHVGAAGACGGSCRQHVLLAAACPPPPPGAAQTKAAACPPPLTCSAPRSLDRHSLTGGFHLPPVELQALMDGLLPGLHALCSTTQPRARREGTWVLGSLPPAPCMRGTEHTVDQLPLARRPPPPAPPPRAAPSHLHSRGAPWHPSAAPHARLPAQHRPSPPSDLQHPGQGRVGWVGGQRMHGMGGSVRASAHPGQGRGLGES